MKVVAPDGTVIDVPSAEAQRGLSAGEYSLQKGQRVNVTDGEGNLTNVPAEELGNALTGGYRLAADAEVQADLERQQYTSTGEQVRTAAEGAARGLTFGGSDLVLSELGADTEAMRLRKEHNEGLAIGSEIVGGVAPLLVTGGASGAASGAGLAARGAGAAARVASAPVRGLAAAGAAVERGVGSVAGKGLLGRMASMGAAGAVEGGVIGAGQALSESVLQDDELTAEMLLAGAGNGALLGGGAGGALGLGGALVVKGAGAVGRGAQATGTRLRGLFGKAEDAAAVGASKADDALTVGAGKADDALASGQAAAGAADDVDRAAMAKAEDGGFVDRYLRQRDAARNIKNVQDAEIRNIAADAGRREKNLSDITDALNISNKHRSAAKAIKKDRAAGLVDDAAALEAATARVRKLQSDVKSLTKSLDAREASAAKKLEKFVDDTDLTLRKLNAEGADASKSFAALDLLKQKVGRIQDRLGGRGTSVREDAFTAGDILRNHYDDLAAHLVDEKLYGRAASEIQRPDNLAWTKWFDTRDGYRKRLLTHGEGQGGERTATGFGQYDIADPAKIAPVIRKLGDVENDLTERLFRENTVATTELLQQLGRSHQMSPKIAKQVAEDAELGARMIASLDKAKRTSADARAHEEMLQELRGFPMAEGVVNLAVNAVDKMLSLRQLQGRAEGVSSKIASAAKSAVSTGKKAAKKAGTAAKQGAARASRRERFDETAERVRKADQMDVIDKVSQEMAATGASGKMVAAVTATAVRGQQFLQSKLPAPIIRGSDRQPHLDKTQRVADAEMSKFLRYADAVKDPMTVVDALERGDLTREGAEALRAVYPKMYNDLKERVTEQIIESKERIPRGKLQQLSVLFDEPYHFSMEPGFMLSMQQAHAAAVQETQSDQTLAPSARKAPDTASAMMTTQQRISQ